MATPPITLRIRGQLEGLAQRIVGRVTRSAVLQNERGNFVLVASNVADAQDWHGYASVLLPTELRELAAAIEAPTVVAPSFEHLKDGYIVAVEPRTGFIMTRYRWDSNYNVLFATEQCNSNCLMCSQPPKDEEDSWRVEENLKIISLVQDPPNFLCISGGEPTLLGDGLLAILTALRDQLPMTSIQMLTNGRRYSDRGFCQQVAAIKHPNLLSAVPLYADVADVHDYIVQAHGAFDETIEGLYNAAEAGMLLEIRIVLHKQSIPRLPQLAEFICQNFPFVAHVALMGLEHMGYVKKNWDILWIDPTDYAGALRKAARTFIQRGLRASIYNLPLCVVPRELWGLARKSISDYKNIYLPQCEDCAVREHCSGLFLSQLERHSSHIQPIPGLGAN